jgi:hypothetical protein
LERIQDIEKSWSIKEVNEYLQLIVNGLCSGLGASVGTYFATRVFIRQIESVEKRLKNGSEKNGKR